MIRLKDTDIVLVAWAESCAGPGWANQPVRVIYRTQEGELKEEWIQPKEQTGVMHILYGVSDLVTRQMCSEATKVLSRKQKHD